MIILEALNLSWLRRARLRKGMTLVQVAKKIGRDRSMLWRYENGESQITVKLLLQLLSVYGVSIGDVIERSDAK